MHNQNPHNESNAALIKSAESRAAARGAAIEIAIMLELFQEGKTLEEVHFMMRGAYPDAELQALEAHAATIPKINN